MLRERVFPKPPEADPAFRWRGTTITRLEGLSDAVFAFSITLLVVSLDTPTTFDELMSLVRGFVAFGLSFAVLISVWWYHNLFFRRYGLNDAYTMWLNALLLFVVLFYVYPLKFLFTFLTDLVLGTHRGNDISAILPWSRADDLLIVYSSGFLAIFVVFLLLYHHAHRQADRLELDAGERLETRATIAGHAATAAIAALTIVLALLLPPTWVPGIGALYFLTGFATWGADRWVRRRAEPDA